MTAQPLPYYTMEQYAAMEDKATHKSEYCAGHISRVNQVSPQHCAIAANITTGIGQPLKQTAYRTYTSNLRVTVMAANFSTYPDVTIVCGEPHVNPFDKNSVINPSVIFEVLSPSTERYDRGEKWARYRRLESLEEYLLVSQDKPKVERYVRQESGLWSYKAVEGLDAASVLTVLGVTLPLAEIYDRITFEESVSVRETADNG